METGVRGWEVQQRVAGSEMVLDCSWCLLTTEGLTETKALRRAEKMA